MKVESATLLYLLYFVYYITENHCEGHSLGVVVEKTEQGPVKVDPAVPNRTK